MLWFGEAVCLFTALLWAGSVTLFQAPIATHGARTVNMAKCTVGTLVQGATVLALGQAGAIATAAPADVLMLGSSGVVGLAIGDTALFAAVGALGVHRTLLLQTLAPVFTAALAAAWQGEIPTPRQGLGAAIVLAGIALVVAPGRRSVPAKIEPPRRWIGWGVAAGTLAAACQGTGLVLAKAGLEQVPTIAASFIRLSAAAVALHVIALVSGRVRRLSGLLRDPAAMRRVLPATMLGTVLALFLMMWGIALAPAAIAAVLLGTSPVFGLILECVMERRWPAPRGVLGTVLAMAGVAVLVTA